MSSWFPVFLMVIMYVAFSSDLTDCVVLSVVSFTPYIATCVISVSTVIVSESVVVLAVTVVIYLSAMLLFTVSVIVVVSWLSSETLFVLSVAMSCGVVVLVRLNVR